MGIIEGSENGGKKEKISLADKIRTGIGIGGTALILAFVINLFYNAFISSRFGSRINNLFQQRKSIEATISTLEEVEAIYGIKNKESFGNYIDKQEIIVDSLKNEEKFLKKKYDKYNGRTFIYGYFTD